MTLKEQYQQTVSSDIRNVFIDRCEDWVCKYRKKIDTLEIIKLMEGSLYFHTGQKHDLRRFVGLLEEEFREEYPVYADYIMDRQINISQN